MLVFGGLLFLKIPDFGDDASNVFKKAGAYFAPYLALVSSFLWGTSRNIEGKKEDALDNVGAFFFACLFSLVHVGALFVAVFTWKNSPLDNMLQADTGIGYFSVFTILAMNFFFIGVVRKK
jgi:predicted transporter